MSQYNDMFSPGDRVTIVETQGNGSTVSSSSTEYRRRLSGSSVGETYVVCRLDAYDADIYLFTVENFERYMASGRFTTAEEAGNHYGADLIAGPGNLSKTDVLSRKSVDEMDADELRTLLKSATKELHKAADAQGLCSQYDTVMRRVGLPDRWSGLPRAIGSVIQLEGADIYAVLTNSNGTWTIFSPTDPSKNSMTARNWDVQEIGVIGTAFPAPVTA